MSVLEHIPDTPGPFPFGPPYHTTGIRVSYAADGIILPRGYAYWQAINAHAEEPSLLVMAGTDRGPQLWEVDKSSHAVTSRGPIFPDSASTGEGWYFSATHPDLLYCSDDEHLYRYHVRSHLRETIVDLTPWEGRYALRQWHSSHDETRHSATVLRVVEEGPWPAIGTIVYEEHVAHPWHWYPAIGKLDESQIDKSGRWLVIKEGDDNRIVDLETGEERTITDQAGAAGHSDLGFGYMVGADNWQLGAAWRLYDLCTGAQPVIYTTSWEAQVLHVSHGNAHTGEPASQWVLGSGTIPDLIQIPLDGSRATVPVAPRLTVMADSYDRYPKASLDPSGTYASWVAFVEGRYDLFLVALRKEH